MGVIKVPSDRLRGRRGRNDHVSHRVDQAGSAPVDAGHDDWRQPDGWCRATGYDPKNRSSS
jgi:hypothetical protein